MNTLTVISERCMSASIARTATVVVWREYRDMDGLGGAEMLEHGAGVATTGSTNSRLGCVRHESHQVERPTKRQREAKEGSTRSSARRLSHAFSPPTSPT